MKKTPLLAVFLLASACSKQPTLNYRHCLKLRVGMPREQIFAAMGRPEETFPYVEGKSLPHLKGRTAYEWSTPSSMPAPNRVSIDDATGLATNISCGNSIVTAAVYVEPPEPIVSTAAAANVTALSGISSGAQVSRPAAPRASRERSSSSLQSSGRPLTE